MSLKWLNRVQCKSPTGNEYNWNVWNTFHISYNVWIIYHEVRTKPPSATVDSSCWFSKVEHGRHYFDIRTGKNRDDMLDRVLTFPLQEFRNFFPGPYKKIHRVLVFIFYLRMNLFKCLNLPKDYHILKHLIFFVQPV